MRLYFETYCDVKIVMEYLCEIPKYSEANLRKNTHNTCLDKLFIDKCLKSGPQLHARKLAWEILSLNGLLSDSGIKYSISHKKKAVVFAFSASKKISSVGVDIEPRNQELSLATKKFFSAKTDKVYNTSLLELWCIKEAALKCLDNFTGRLNLKMIKIQQISDKKYIAIASNLNCVCELFDNNSKYILAAAWR